MCRHIPVLVSFFSEIKLMIPENNAKPCRFGTFVTEGLFDHRCVLISEKGDWISNC